MGHVAIPTLGFASGVGVSGSQDSIANYEFRRASASARDCMYVTLLMLAAGRENPISRTVVGVGHRRQYDLYRTRRIGRLGLVLLLALLRST